MFIPIPKFLSAPLGAFPFAPISTSLYPSFCLFLPLPICTSFYLSIPLVLHLSALLPFAPILPLSVPLPFAPFFTPVCSHPLYPSLPISLLHLFLSVITSFFVHSSIPHCHLPFQPLFTSLSVPITLMHLFLPLSLCLSVSITPMHLFLPLSNLPRPLLHLSIPPVGSPTPSCSSHVYTLR